MKGPEYIDPRDGQPWRLKGYGNTSHLFVTKPDDPNYYISICGTVHAYFRLLVWEDAARCRLCLRTQIYKEATDA